MTPTLTQKEKELAKNLGFEEDILLLLKECTSSSLKEIELETKGVKPKNPQNVYFSCIEYQKGISTSALSAEKAINIVQDYQEELQKKGYFIFVGKLHIYPIDKQHTIFNEISLIKTNDQYDILRTMKTAGGNYNITTDDIITKLKDWDTKYSLGLKIIGADRNKVTMTIIQTPQAIKEFTADVFEFAPDVMDDMLLQMGKSLDKIDMGMHAQDVFIDRIKNKRRFWLWWD